MRGMLALRIRGLYGVCTAVWGIGICREGNVYAYAMMLCYDPCIICHYVNQYILCIIYMLCVNEDTRLDAG